MIVAINQPAYLAWLGYYYRIARADVFIRLDHVQFEKNSMVNRNKIKTANGPIMLTVPVKTSGKFGNLPIAELQIDLSNNWSRKHMIAIKQAYSKAAFFEEVYPNLEQIFLEKWTDLNKLLIRLDDFVLDYLGVKTKVMQSSMISAHGVKSELILNLCKELQATEYLSGPFGKDYLDLPSFMAAGIKVDFVEYQHPTYRQLHQDFIPNLSVFDLLFNYGKGSLNIILAGN